MTKQCASGRTIPWMKLRKTKELSCGSWSKVAPCFQPGAHWLLVVGFINCSEPSLSMLISVSCSRTLHQKREAWVNIGVVPAWRDNTFDP